MTKAKKYHYSYKYRKEHRYKSLKKQNTYNNQYRRKHRQRTKYLNARSMTRKFIKMGTAKDLSWFITTAEKKVHQLERKSRHE